MVHRPLYTYVRNDGSLTNSYSEAHWEQVNANIRELEVYLEKTSSDSSLLELLQFMKLNLKLPLLISGRRADYERWRTTYPESHPYIQLNNLTPWRTKLLQQMAARGQYWFVALYAQVIMKGLYKLLYH